MKAIISVHRPCSGSDRGRRVVSALRQGRRSFSRKLACRWLRGRRRHRLPRGI